MLPDVGSGRRRPIRRCRHLGEQAREAAGGGEGAETSEDESGIEAWPELVTHTLEDHGFVIVMRAAGIGKRLFECRRIGQHRRWSPASGASLAVIVLRRYQRPSSRL